MVLSKLKFSKYLLIILVIILVYDSIQKNFNIKNALKDFVRLNNVLNNDPKIISINACVIFVLQNKDLKNLVPLIQRFELAFNKNHHYPYVF